MENNDIVFRITRAKAIADLVEYQASLVEKVAENKASLDAMNLTEEQISTEVTFYYQIKSIS